MFLVCGLYEAVSGNYIFYLPEGLVIFQFARMIQLEFRAGGTGSVDYLFRLAKIHKKEKEKYIEHMPAMQIAFLILTRADNLKCTFEELTSVFCSPISHS